MSDFSPAIDFLRHLPGWLAHPEALGAPAWTGWIPYLPLALLLSNVVKTICQNELRPILEGVLSALALRFVPGLAASYLQGTPHLEMGVAALLLTATGWVFLRSFAYGIVGSIGMCAMPFLILKDVLRIEKLKPRRS